VPLVTAALIIGALALATPAQSATKPVPSSLTVYSRMDDSQWLDTGVAGTSDGDESFLHGPLSKTPNGPTVGEYFYMSFTVRTDTLDSLTWRESTWDYSLPGGTIMVGGVLKSAIGKVLGKGDVVHLVILGGTGIYRGVRGEMIGTIVADNPPLQRAHFIFVK
jgi:hypothetical protein